MTNSYNIISSTVTVINTSATLLKIGFGSPAQNDQIVKDAQVALEDCKLEGGALVLLNGPASLPVTCTIAHAICHIFGAVGAFDPKLAAYVVAISHNPTYKVGDLIPSADVKE
jgi:CRISPR-associated protein Csx3